MAILYHGDPTSGSPAYPGSIRARTAGCTCDVFINQGGRGHVSGLKDMLGRPVFEVVAGCSVHSAASDVGAYPTNSSTLVPKPPVSQVGG